jgi:hypothetical protein
VQTNSISILNSIIHLHVSVRAGTLLPS